MRLRFFDLETRGTVDLKKHGLAAYIEGLVALTLVTWQDVELPAGTAGPVEVWRPMTEPAPATLCDLEGLWVAYNARFDRLAWNQCRGLYGLPELLVERVLDLMAQCAASGLPEGLARAAAAAGLPAKLDKKGMLFLADAANPLPTDPAVWAEFIEYGKRDTELLWPLWRRTHALSAREWEEWHASARINDAGLPLDLALTRAIAAAAKIEDEATRDRMVELCGLTPQQSVALIAWVWDQVDDEARAIIAPDGKSRSLSTKAVLPALLECTLPPGTREVLEALLGAKSPASGKAAAILKTAVRERATGCYLFNGASTGRFSSRGVQVHNLSRPIRGLALVPALLAGEKLDPGEVRLPRALAATLRGCIRAGEGKTLVWCDWAAIEARVLPWLAFAPHGLRTAGRRAERVLDLFRAGEDIYLDAARGIYGLALGAVVTAEQRLVGKVATLALGFGGAVGAFERMAALYGVKVEDPKEIIRAWRAANPWAPWLWSALERAVEGAYAAPGAGFVVGRVEYYLEGPDLLCRLPSGRRLVYRALRRFNETDQWGRRRVVWEYRRGNARVRLWGGSLAENITQAAAADLLRDALRRAEPLGVVGHTHDEIILEVPEWQSLQRLVDLHAVMVQAPAWAEGLPLAAEGKVARRYGK